MRRSSRAEWAKRVEQWKQSGLTAAEFATRAGVRARTLSWWAWRLRGAASARTPPVVEVIGLTEPAVLELVLDRARVRVPAGFDAESLRRLLAVLEGG